MFPSVYSTIKMSFSLTNNDRLLSPSIHLGSIHEIYNIPMKDINCPFPSIVDEIKAHKHLNSDTIPAKLMQTILNNLKNYFGPSLPNLKYIYNK
ncbi:unnamed protein product [Rotaria sp. Silwood1]|nr:unnamed protein product [Rotaria sp. Silwood1]CAF1274485.1 unnamed protein product [Rotaria sp. Silwood1]CAF3483721.1 unnamed protein product [Rotaria sp. Silwood1]CAF3520166.1 unnamed protein product [Rotaria sp. Silwood1]CAF4957696.1 unnamed protein product [Rotaria sp. Silwood1]